MIAIASDHAGFELKELLKKHLNDNGYDFVDVGCDSTQSCDYPVFAQKACEKVVSGECSKAVLVCGTGIGMSMAANKVKGIRAAVCSDAFSTKYTRRHNDANVICFGARVIGPGLAEELLDIFLTESFEGGKHLRRIDMLEK